MRRALLAAGLLLAPLVVGASAQEAAHPRWAASIEKGLAEAKSRGVAMMVALNMDRERGNQGMVDDVYTSPAFHEAAKACVIAVGSLYEHPQKGAFCGRFGSVSCAAHQAIEKTIRHDWLKRGPKDDVESPRHFFLAPDGKILFQRTWTVGAPELASLMRRASELCTPERLAAWDTLEGQIQRALDPIPAVRDIALADLIAKNDAEIDAQLVAAAKAAKDPLVAGSVLGAFARAEEPGRRKWAHTALSHKDPGVRLMVAHAMLKSGKTDHVPPLLSRAPKEKDAKAKGAIYRGLGELAQDSKDAKKVGAMLRKAVASTKDPARDHAAVAVAPWAKEKAVKAALSKVLLQGGSTELRSAAAWALGYSEDKEVKDSLVAYHESLSRRDWRLRKVVEAAIEKLRGKGSSRYDKAPDYFLPHPAEGSPPPPFERGAPRGK